MVGEGGGVAGSVGGNRELFYPGSPLSLSVNGRGRRGGGVAGSVGGNS